MPSTHEAVQETSLSASIIGFSATQSYRRVKVSPVCGAVCCSAQESYINQMCRLISGSAGSINLLGTRLLRLHVEAVDENPSRIDHSAFRSLHMQLTFSWRHLFTSIRQRSKSLYSSCVLFKKLLTWQKMSRWRWWSSCIVAIGFWLRLIGSSSSVIKRRPMFSRWHLVSQMCWDKEEASSSSYCIKSWCFIWLRLDSDQWETRLLQRRAGWAEQAALCSHGLQPICFLSSC